MCIRRLVHRSNFICRYSLYFKIYFMRAESYLWDSEQSYSQNGVFIHGFDDSTLVEKAIMDFKKCIQLYFIKPKSFTLTPQKFPSDKYRMRVTSVINEHDLYVHVLPSVLESIPPLRSMIPPATIWPLP